MTLKIHSQRSRQLFESIGAGSDICLKSAEDMPPASLFVPDMNEDVMTTPETEAYLDDVFERDGNNDVMVAE